MRVSSENRPEAGAYCSHCGQSVKPIERHGWRNFWAWFTLLQFAAVIAAIVASVHPYTVAGGIVGRLILWPAAVHPAWLSILAAIGAFLASAVLTAVAGERAGKNRACPKCGMRLASQPPSPA